MTEATWGDGLEPRPIDWRMSASLRNVPRGGNEVVEVTNLAQAVHDWASLDPRHQGVAVLVTEHPVFMDGGNGGTSFSGDAIAALVAKLPGHGALI